MSMHAQLEEFIVVQRSRLVEKLLRDKNLPHIVNSRCVHQIGSLLRREPKSASHDFAVSRHEVAMSGYLHLTRFGGAAQ